MEIKIPKDNTKTIDAIVSMLGLIFPTNATDLLKMTEGAKNGITIEVLPTKKEQTNSQRGYYWKWLRSFAAFTGNTPDEMHEYVLGECYGTETIETSLGDMIRPLKRSHDANRDEYSELIDTLIRIASNFDFIVPPPVIDAEEWGYFIP